MSLNAYFVKQPSRRNLKEKNIAPFVVVENITTKSNSSEKSWTMLFESNSMKEKEKGKTKNMPHALFIKRKG